MSRMGAPEGIRHGKATAPFDLIERIRDDYEYCGMKPKELSLKYGISLNTIRDWVYWRTRLTA